MAIYNPQNVKTSLFRILIQGVMDGEFFTAEHREDDVELHVGSQGFTTFVENANKSGMVSFMLSQMSPTNRALSIAFAAKTIGIFQMEDLSDGTLIVGADSRIMKHAPVKRGNKIVGLEWKILVPKLVIANGGDL
jgi:hypothetical protein